MCYLGTSVISVVLFAFGQTQGVTKDPIADFMELNLSSAGRLKGFAEISLVRADISGDGEPEIFITHDKLKGDRAGRPWKVYTPVRGGYKPISMMRATAADGRTIEYEGLAKFRTDAFHIGSIKGAEGTELFSYKPGGGQSGVMVGIWLRDGALEERKVREMIVGARTRDLDEFNRLFGSERGEIVKAKVEDLATEAQRMALIGGPPESAAGFVSRIPEEPDAGQEEAAVESEEAAPAANAPSVRAASDEEADERAAAAEVAEPENPGGSGWSSGVLLVSIGAVVFLLAHAGYRVFKKAPSDS